MYVSAGWQPVFRELGLDAEAVFEHELVRPWRRLPDRENCTLDAALTDGRKIRWHVKRYAPPRLGRRPAAGADVAGWNHLRDRQIPTVDLVAHGVLEDGRSFVILDDLAGYDAADKLIERGAVPFERLLEPTARLAAKLHEAGLHHRDLYLCHFFATIEDEVDLRLIDTTRVRPLPRLLAARWIVKDLAQFAYSTTLLPVGDEQRNRWLARYAQHRGIEPQSLAAPVKRKVRWIARSDRRTRRSEPLRNVSIPAAAGEGEETT